MRTLRELPDIEGKRVLLRVDWNLPMVDGKIEDDLRLTESLETIRFLLAHQARLIICSHLGRPAGKREPAFSLEPVVARFRDLLVERKLKAPVRFSGEVVGTDVEHVVAATKPGEILVLENLRFEPGEEQNDAQFSAKLAALADLYVDDAFGAIHRAHASVVGVANLLESYAGLLVEREVKTLENLEENPAKPFVLILGGAKPDDKIAVMQNLAQKVDKFLVAGGIGNTFLKVKGVNIQESLSGQNNSFTVAKDLLTVLGDRLILPTDFIWKDKAIADVGKATISTFEKHIGQASTIFWNGNIGMSEDPKFAQGTRAVAVAIAASQGKSVVGGGDTVAAIDQLGLRKHISFVSTGGGATLEFLAGKSFPGLEVLGYRVKG